MPYSELITLVVAKITVYLALVALILARSAGCTKAVVSTHPVSYGAKSAVSVHPINFVPVSLTSSRFPSTDTNTFSSNSSKSNKGKMAGGALGGLAVTTAAIGAYIFAYGSTRPGETASPVYEGKLSDRPPSALRPLW